MCLGESSGLRERRDPSQGPAQPNQENVQIYRYTGVLHIYIFLIIILYIYIYLYIYLSIYL